MSAKLRKRLDKLKGIALSDTDVQQITGGKVVLVRNLPKYMNIDQLLDDNGVCYLLYEMKDHSGHWCCLIKTKINGEPAIEFFDSYGGKPDTQLDWIDPTFAKSTGQDRRILTQFLVDSDYPISYNQYPFQELDKDIASCGRWCAIRGRLKDLPLEDFSKLFIDLYSHSASHPSASAIEVGKKNKDRATGDDLVTMMTADVGI